MSAQRLLKTSSTASTHRGVRASRPPCGTFPHNVHRQPFCALLHCPRLTIPLDLVIERPNSRVSLDESRWPFVVLTPPSDELSDAEVTLHIEELKAFASRGGRFGFVFDVRQVPIPGAARRRLMAEQMDKLMQRDGHRCIGVAVVLSSAPARAVFKALAWLRQSAYPFAAAETVQHGIEWLRSLERARPETTL